LLLLFTPFFVGCVSRSATSLSVQLMPSSAQSLEQGQTIPISAAVLNDREDQGVTWSLTGVGSLAAETPSSVVYQAPADTTVPVSVRVTATSKAESSKTASLTLWLVAPLKILTCSETLPRGRPGLPFAVTKLVSIGGVGPYEWSLKAGSLPPGLNLTPVGVISGVPESAGTFEFTVEVKDAENFTASAELKIIVSGDRAVGHKRVRFSGPTLENRVRVILRVSSSF
jgi:hypothetical protein